MIHDHGAATISTPVVAVDIEAAKPKRQRRAAADLRDRPVLSTVAAVKDPRDDWIHLSTWSLHQYLTLDMNTKQNEESLARLTQGLVCIVRNDTIKEHERSISLAIAACLRLLQQEAPTASVSELVIDTLSNALSSQEAAEIEVCGSSLIRSSLIPTDEAKLAVSAAPPRASSKTIVMTRPEEWQRSILSLPSLAEILPPNSQGGLDSATIAFGIPQFLLQHAQSWLNSSATEESLYWASQYLDLAATLTKREAASLATIANSIPSFL
jgi:hypothetical protein